MGRQFGVRMRAVDVFGGGGGACGSGRHGLCLDALDRLDHRPDLAQPDQVLAHAHTHTAVFIKYIQLNVSQLLYRN